jgi:hypothetical protein
MMLTRLLPISFLTVVLVFMGFYEGTRATPRLAGQPNTSLNEVKQAILTATGFEPAAVELTATSIQFVVTLVTRKFTSGPASQRESEASRITAAIATVIAEMPEYKGIQAIHIDYVSRKRDGGASRIIDLIDFRKDAPGKFQHHIT